MSRAEVEAAVDRVLEQDFDQVDYGNEPEPRGSELPAAEWDALHPWGSVQYDGSARMYKRLRELDAQRGLGVANALEQLGIDASYGNVVSAEEAWDDFRAAMDDHYDEAFFHGWGGDEWTDTQAELDAMEHSYDAMFRFLRDHAWDLWSAAPFIANLALPGLRVVSPHEETEGDGENAGVISWLLYALGLVEDESVFADFDT